MRRSFIQNYQKYHLLCALLALSVAGQAQPLALSAEDPAEIQDLISLGAPGAASNRVFYSLQRGEVKKVTDGWHLAFDVRGRSAVIRANHALIDLFRMDKTDLSNEQAWTRLHDSTASWDVSAFNGKDDFWGAYNPVTHAVVGKDDCYVLRWKDDTNRRALKIDRLIGGVYHFVFWELAADGTLGSRTAAEVDGSSYGGKNFVYYSLTDGTVLDLEPKSSEWDLLFTYYEPIIGGNSVVKAGVLSNAGVEVRQFDKLSGQPTSTAADAIGHQWLDASGKLVGGRRYLVSRKGGAVWRLVFWGFNAGAGEISLLRSVESTGESLAALSGCASPSVVLYPNRLPSGGARRVSLRFPRDFHSFCVARVFDQRGGVMHRESCADGELWLPSELPSGLYFVDFSNGDVTRSRLIVE